MSTGLSFAFVEYKGNPPFKSLAEIRKMSSGLKKFESEKQVEERKKKRQEEWEKVRKAEDPKEKPEPEYDGRTLFDQLQEQKEKKQLEFEEQHKFKNQFRGIDEDEADFLTQISKQAAKVEQEKRRQEQEELEEFKEAMVKEAAPVEPTVTSQKKPVAKNVKKNNAQQNILKMAVKRKSNTNASTEDKKLKEETEKNTNDLKSVSKVVFPPATTCIGVLPGIGNYGDSDKSSDEEDHCLLSRIIKPPPDD